MTPDDFREHLNTTADLTHHEWAVGQALACFMDDDGRCWPSVATLARITHLGHGTVRASINGCTARAGQKAIPGLVARGLLIAERRRKAGMNLTTVYTGSRGTPEPGVGGTPEPGAEEVESFEVERHRTPVHVHRNPVQSIGERFRPHGEPIGEPEAIAHESAVGGADGAMVAGAAGSEAEEMEGRPVDSTPHVPDPHETVAEQRARYRKVAWTDPDNEETP